MGLGRLSLLSQACFVKKSRRHKKLETILECLIAVKDFIV